MAGPSAAAGAIQRWLTPRWQADFRTQRATVMQPSAAALSILFGVRELRLPAVVGIPSRARRTVALTRITPRLGAGSRIRLSETQPLSLVAKAIPAAEADRRLAVGRTIPSRDRTELSAAERTPQLTAII